MNSRLISVLAHAFSKVLKEWLTAEEMETVIKRNNSHHYSDMVCASHDFCDANMAMNKAFNRVLRRNALVHSDKDITLWNSAWNVAKENNFFIN